MLHRCVPALAAWSRATLSDLPKRGRMNESEFLGADWLIEGMFFQC